MPDLTHPLIQATLNNNLDLIYSLLNKNNDLTPYCVEMMDIACYKGYFDIVRFLVRRGYPFDDNFSNFYQYFHENRRLDILDYVLSHGANPNAANAGGFAHAIVLNDIKIIDVFIKNGVEIKDRHLGLALQKSSDKTVLHLFKHCPSILQMITPSVIVRLVNYNRLACYRYLIHHGLDFRYHTLLLQGVCKHGHLKFISYLMELGADPYLKDPNGNTSIIVVLQNAQKKVLKLLEKSFHVDIKSNKNELFQYATQSNEGEFIQYFIKQYQPDFSLSIHQIFNHSIKHDLFNTLQCLLENYYSTYQSQIQTIVHQFNEDTDGKKYMESFLLKQYYDQQLDLSSEQPSKGKI